MGIPSEMRDLLANRKIALVIPSPLEDEKMLRTRQCTQEGVRAGAKAAAVACVASAVPTLVAVRTIPWAKANLNYTAQALIISAELRPALLAIVLLSWLLIASIAAYFITADKTILECARRNAQFMKFNYYMGFLLYFLDFAFARNCKKQVKDSVALSIWGGAAVAETASELLCETRVEGLTYKDAGVDNNEKNSQDGSLNWRFWRGLPFEYVYFI
ncbi:Early nodulin-93 [Sesamum angolense]|uniref:Early nodulin-93 n=1 Tax=Sesamum angolense TaxID=2727404 RepID=A0AAE1W8N1_9LAMI|nr:Early nodulin-93 [Sesamum angolense]